MRNGGGGEPGSSAPLLAPLLPDDRYAAVPRAGRERVERRRRRRPGEHLHAPVSPRDALLPSSSSTRRWRSHLLRLILPACAGPTTRTSRWAASMACRTASRTRETARTRCRSSGSCSPSRGPRSRTRACSLAPPRAARPRLTALTACAATPSCTRRSAARAAPPT